MTSSYSYQKIIQKKYDRVIPWLDEIPSHWDFVRSKTVFSQRKEFARPDDIQLSATQAYGVISQKEYEKKVGRKVVQIFQHLEKRAHVEPDDFVISMRSFQGGLERAWERGCIRSSYVVLQPNRELDVSYFTHLFKSKAYIAALQATGNFIRDGQDLNFSNFTKVNLPLPPLQEQKIIGSFLNKIIKLINNYIHNKKQLIILLKEQKQSIINNAVTKGINPNAKMKASEFELISDYPAHWNVIPLKSIAKLRKSINCQNLDLLSVYLNIGVVKFSDIDEKRTNTTSLDLSKYQEVFSGDLVLNNQQAWRGSVGVSSYHGIVSPAYLVLELDDKLNSEFANYLFRSRVLVDQYLICSKGVGSIQRNLYWDYLKKSIVIFPNIDEQMKIVKHINVNTSDLDQSILRAERQILLIQEYRDSLITDAVTGKIDVRNIEIPSISDEDFTSVANSAEIIDDAMNYEEDE